MWFGRVPDFLFLFRKRPYSTNIRIIFVCKIYPVVNIAKAACTIKDNYIILEKR